MRRLTISLDISFGKDDDDLQREGSADALVERADPARHIEHELDHRPIGFRLERS
jgi:hypothetical protein